MENSSHLKNIRWERVSRCRIDGVFVTIFRTCSSSRKSSKSREKTRRTEVIRHGWSQLDITGHNEAMDSCTCWRPLTTASKRANAPNNSNSHLWFIGNARVTVWFPSVINVREYFVSSISPRWRQTHNVKLSFARVRVARSATKRPSYGNSPDI